MNPKAPFSRVLFFLADGARPDVLRLRLDAGQMPNVARYIAGKGGCGTAVSVFPSVTGTAYAPFITGLYPGRAGITGIRWFDRQAFGKPGFNLQRHRSYYGWGAYLMDLDLAKEARTLFEIFRRPVNIYSGINRGAGLIGNKGFFLRVPMVAHFMWTGNWDYIEKMGVFYTHWAAYQRAEVTFHTVLSIDEYSHLHDPTSPQVMKAYDTLDEVIGKTCRLLEKLRLLDQTLIVLSSDHGHTHVFNHFDTEGYVEDYGLKTLYYPRPKIPRRDVEAACMVSGNGHAQIYLRGRRGWPERVMLEEIEDRFPGFLGGLRKQDAVDILAVLEAPGVIRVESRRGQARVRYDGAYVDYEIDGADPFGYPALPRRMTSRESLEATVASDYPDALVQLGQLVASPRGGDVIVSATPGWDLRARFERKEHKSCHGSLHRNHMVVPLAMNHPFTNGALRTVDVYPTILRLTGKPLTWDIDGEAFVS